MEVANLIFHMAGNLHQRLSAGVGGAADVRDREAEFSETVSYTREQLIAVAERAFVDADRILAELTPERLSNVQRIRNRQVTLLDVLFTVATHMSEHVGQILYIAKLRLGPAYRTLSIPRRRLQAVFVDRDGTLGGTGHFIHPRDFELYPWSGEALQLLRDAGLKVFAFTNQHRIGHGMAIEEEFHQQFREFGLHGAYICPHKSDEGCECRKPAPGMLHRAAREQNLELSRCAVIGDVGSTDMKAAAAVGAVKVLVRTGWGEGSLGEYRDTWAEVEPDYVAENLLEAARWLVGRAQHG